MGDAQVDDLGMAEATTLGREFATALAAKDFDRIAELLHPEIDFRGLTPKRNWEASNPETVISGVLREWFEDSDEIEEVEQIETTAVADRARVGYRFKVRAPDGLFMVEQQTFIGGREGRIGWMRVLCSGFRPIADKPTKLERPVHGGARR